MSNFITKNSTLRNLESPPQSPAWTFPSHQHLMLHSQHYTTICSLVPLVPLSNSPRPLASHHTVAELTQFSLSRSRDTFARGLHLTLRSRDKLILNLQSPFTTVFSHQLPLFSSHHSFRHSPIHGPALVSIFKSALFCDFNPFPHIYHNLTHCSPSCFVLPSSDKVTFHPIFFSFACTLSPSFLIIKLKTPWQLWCGVAFNGLIPSSSSLAILF